MELENKDKQSVTNNSDHSSLKDRIGKDAKESLENTSSPSRIDEARPSTKKQRSFIIRGFITIFMGIILIPVVGIFISMLMVFIGVAIVVVDVLIRLDERKRT